MTGYDRVAKNLGVTFVDLNSWIGYGDFGRGQKGVSQLGHFNFQTV